MESRHKAIAPCFGLDLATVVRHCVDARHRAFVRNICVTLLLLASLAVASFNQPASGIALMVVGLFVISFVWEWQIFGLVRKHLKQRSFTGHFLGDKYEKKVAHLKSAGAGNVVVYSGFTPFVGSGVLLNSWNLAVDLHKGKEFAGIRTAPDTFTVPELYAAIEDAIQALGLHNCTLEDRIHISGADVRDDTRFLQDTLGRPVDLVDAAVMKHTLANPSMRVRHYRLVRVVDWSGELVLSFFVRFLISGHNLFMEASSHLLTPIDGMNRSVEQIYAEISVLQIAKRLMYAILWCLVYPWWSPVNVLYRMVHPFYKFIHNLIEDWIISEDPLYDYGAASSLRETACGSFVYRRHGQKLDGDMSQKIVEQTTLDTLLRFLDEHHIDTSSLKDRETTLLNNGVIMSGGKINAGSLSVGKNAQSIFQKITRSRKKSAAAGAAA